MFYCTHLGRVTRLCKVVAENWQITVTLFIFLDLHPNNSHQVYVLITFLILMDLRYRKIVLRYCKFLTSIRKKSGKNQEFLFSATWFVCKTKLSSRFHELHIICSLNDYMQLKWRKCINYHEILLWIEASLYSRLIMVILKIKRWYGYR